MDDRSAFSSSSEVDGHWAGGFAATNFRIFSPLSVSPHSYSLVRSFARSFAPAAHLPSAFDRQSANPTGVGIQRSRSLPCDGQGERGQRTSMPPLETTGVFGGQYQDRGGNVPQHLTSSHEEDYGNDFARKISLLSREANDNGSTSGRKHSTTLSSASDSDSNNNGAGRCSFDMLLSDLASMELAASSAAERRKSDGDFSARKLAGSVRTMAKAFQMRGGGSAHAGTSVADYLSRNTTQLNNHPPTEGIQATSTGYIIDSKPVTSSETLRKFRAGPSVGAHASKLVDGESASWKRSQPKQIVAADLHDTYGASDWAMPGDGADWRQKVARTEQRENREQHHRIVSKTPTLSPIRSPIGSPKPSPRGIFMATNMSSHVSPYYLERRSARLAQMQREDEAEEEGLGSGRGYIAEAKRVLDEAMHMLDAEATAVTNGGGGATASSNPQDAVSLSPSGALEPLMKHLKAAAGDDKKCRAALRTLTLLETNLPNREIVSDLQGRRILMDVVLKCSAEAMDVKENAIQLMWDLDQDSGRDAASCLNESDLHALVQVLGETTSCEVASHTLHFLKAAIDQPPESRPYISEDGLKLLAARLASETCSHKHPIPDSAQYCLGEALAQILSELASIDEPYANGCLGKILDSLGPCGDETQCQILLTVLSALAVKRRLLKILVDVDGFAKIHRFCTRTTNSRLHARGFSLWKVVSSNASINPSTDRRTAHRAASWYFGED